METIDGSSLLTALLVATGLCGALATLWKGAEALRHLSGADRRAAERASNERRLREIDSRVEACEERLRQDGARFESVRGDMTQMLTALNALLMHFISGNDHERLRDVKKNLDDYLSGR